MQQSDRKVYLLTCQVDQLKAVNISLTDMKLFIRHRGGESTGATGAIASVDFEEIMKTISIKRNFEDRTKFG